MLGASRGAGVGARVLHTSRDAGGVLGAGGVADVLADARVWCWWGTGCWVIAWVLRVLGCLCRCWGCGGGAKVLQKCWWECWGDGC